ncbi:MAG: cytochrome c oxidase subunit 4 [Micrococcaceae bacterium]
MRFEAKMFIGLGIFFVPIGFIYGYLSDWKELAGFPAIVMSGLLALMIGIYLNLTVNHSGHLPEDDDHGEIAQGAGEQGFFSPWSWWPLVLGLSGAALVTGLALGWWIFIIGIGIGVVGLIGFVFEYSRGDHAH